jgi:hypothetical protein
MRYFSSAAKELRRSSHERQSPDERTSMFSVICAARGAAPLAGYHAHCTFDFNQAAHPAFALVVAPVPGAPSGVCLALTMEWLHNWRAHAMTAYVTWVGVNGGGHANVLNSTVAAFAPPGPWDVTTSLLMGGMGFVPFGVLTAGPTWGTGVAALPGIVLGAQSTILVASGPNGAHAVGVRRVGGSVFFFDPNHGELHFQAAADFAEWFFAGGYSRACLTPVVGGAAPRFHTLRYN